MRERNIALIAGIGYPTLDRYGFSFELGSIKPESHIYRATCKLVNVLSEGMFRSQVMMIGDSQSCDRDGPRKAGIQGFQRVARELVAWL
ncbi:hypothetical protein C6380_05160 [Pseudomonas syringae pv. actinidiae]|nr:hypothetical protein BUE61_17615 [Pseudomonas syringae pv. actinidiae]PBK51876.1 hypothetical protein BUE60_17840 [Pseudomonas syringae pv. actinidiae]RJX54355.1 hypothetical protein C6379_15990 [Pseudomonas syringae pv. actinidiae]RJX60191.1 hypothetical protein C6380_05160 [Pseudomonas syringae pv. actinidiae]RJX60316.1 hypothetical protein C6383_13755 [Pseudomonas syringae pv. actinidiae]